MKFVELKKHFADYPRSYVKKLGWVLKHKKFLGLLGIADVKVFWKLLKKEFYSVEEEELLIMRKKRKMYIPVYMEGSVVDRLCMRDFFGTNLTFKKKDILKLKNLAEGVG